MSTRDCEETLLRGDDAALSYSAHDRTAGLSSEAVNEPKGWSVKD